MQKALLQKLKSLDLVRKEDIQLKNAGSSNLYIDVKKAYGDPMVLSLLCDVLWQDVSPKATCIAASGYGGLPPASVLAARYDLKLSLVRDEVKDHGAINQIDGYVPTSEDQVVIVDDVFTTGGSLRKTVEIVRSTGAGILGCRVVVKRGEGALDVPLSHIFVLEDLL